MHTLSVQQRQGLDMSGLLLTSLLKPTKQPNLFAICLQTDSGVSANRWGNPSLDVENCEADPLCQCDGLLHHGV